MKGCDDYSATIQIYLDGELSGQDLEDFPPHLKECDACRTELEAQERLSALLHRSRPLYSAPDALRARVMQAAESFNSTTSYAPVHVRRRIATASAWPLLAITNHFTRPAGCRSWRSQVRCVSCHNSSRCRRAPAPARNYAAVACQQLHGSRGCGAPQLSERQSSP
jgi:mycothiol system anti-sigma-R factor